MPGQRLPCTVATAVGGQSHGTATEIGAVPSDRVYERLIPYEWRVSPQSQDNFDQTGLLGTCQLPYRVYRNPVQLLHCVQDR